VISGGSYNLAAGQTQSVAIRDSPSVEGNNIGSVAFSGGGGASAALNATATAVNGLSFPAPSGTISSPFAVIDSSVSQSVDSDLTSGGRAGYSFSIPAAGKYAIAVNVNAASDGSNSVFVNIDSEPTDPFMIWDINVTSGVQTRFVSWRGNGSFDQNEFVPKWFDLSAGIHQLIVRGREPNVVMTQFTIQPQPAPPSNLRITPNP
jgi:hypothetical protein